MMDLSAEWLRRFIEPQTWDDVLGPRVGRKGKAARRKSETAWREFVIAAEDAGLLTRDADALRWQLTDDGMRQVLEGAASA
jgi:hypothetical protein